MRVKRTILKYVFVLLMVVILLYLCLDSYIHFNQIYPSIDDFLQNPSLYDGVEIEMMGRMKDVKDNAFTLTVNKRDVPIITGGVKVRTVGGGFAVVHGIYSEGGYINMLDIHYAPYHYLKYVISFIALITVVVYLFHEWRFTKKGLVQNA